MQTILAGDGFLEVEELLANMDVINWHSFYGKELMREFTAIDLDRDGFIRYYNARMPYHNALLS